jgi:hypothetical protein
MTLLETTIKALMQYRKENGHVRSITLCPCGNEAIDGSNMCEVHRNETENALA